MRRVRRVCIGLLVSSPMTGCAVGPNFVSPDYEVRETYIANVAIPEGEVAFEQWWDGFDDPTLSQLIDKALEENFDVRQAIARLSQARQAVVAQRSDLFPRVDGAVDGQLRRGLSDAQPDSLDTESVTGGGVLAFVPDVFGGGRRSVEAARAAALAASYDLQELKRLTASAIAATYIELRRTDARLTLLDTSLDLQRRTLEIVSLRAEAGLAADLDVQRASADLSRTQAQRGPLEASRAAALYSLAILIGEAPGETQIDADQAGNIPDYTGGPSLVLPANMIRMRPDVQAAEARLASATAQIGVELADLYPSLSLPGQIQVDLASGDPIAETAVANVSALIDIPLFDAGRRRAEVQSARAGANAALFAYEETLVRALADVENALEGLDGARQRQTALAEAVTASERAFDQLQALYTEGLATLIDVLDAQRQLIASREAFVNSEADLASSFVTFYVALGWAETPTTA